MKHYVPSRRFGAVTLLVASALLLSACNGKPRESRTLEVSFDAVCVDGVEYLVRFGFDANRHHAVMAPHMKPDGTLYLCASGNDQVKN